MTYERAWYDLKYTIDRAVEEGVLCGFSKDDGSNKMENGMYRVYKRVQDKMEILEKEIK